MSKPITERNVLAVILGGGRGSRLFPLTKERAKPAVPIAGKYRLIDFPVSNCINSKIRNIYVLTQFNSVSLHRHLQQSFAFERFTPGFVRILAAQQTIEDGSWFQGNADAVRQNLRHILQAEFEYILILSGDQLYRMDYRLLLEQHRETGAEITVAVIPVKRSEASALGILQLDEDRRIVRFEEKPKDPALLDDLRMDRGRQAELGLPGDEDHYMASMGIYLFSRESLKRALESDSTDFGGHIIPASIGAGGTYGYAFQGYWEDVGTISTFYNANVALCGGRPAFSFFDQDAPMYTHARSLPASRIQDSFINRSLIADGCVILASSIEESVIGVRSFIGEGCSIRNTVIMGCDYYERAEDKPRDEVMGIPHLSIGVGSRIERAIIDKNADIGDNVTIVGGEGRPDEDGPNHYVRDGIVIVPKGAVIPPGSTL